MNVWIARVFVTALAAAAQCAWAQSKLPPCPGYYAMNKWSNCFGSHNTDTGARYDGEWVNDKFEGFGTYRYYGGAKYVGQFKNNRRNGQGTFTFRDGATYVGGFKDDLRTGKGTFTYPNGVKFVGMYGNDKRNGPGIEYGADGQVLRSGIWEDDALKISR